MIEIIFTSPRLRARETVEIVGKKLDVPLEVIDDLRERNNYGVLSGMTKAEAKEKHPIDFEKLTKDKTYHDVTDSESYEEITDRAIRVFEQILSKEYGVIAIISHGGMISTYVREVLAKGKEVKLGDCAILEINKDEEKFSVSCLSGAELN